MLVIGISQFNNKPASPSSSSSSSSNANSTAPENRDSGMPSNIYTILGICVMLAVFQSAAWLSFFKVLYLTTLIGATSLLRTNSSLTLTMVAVVLQVLPGHTHLDVLHPQLLNDLLLRRLTHDERQCLRVSSRSTK